MFGLLNGMTTPLVGRNCFYGATLCIAMLCNAAVRELPGQLSSGEVLLPNQWRLMPAGHQIAVGDFPVNIAMHPGGRFAAILHSGHGTNEVMVVDYRERKIVDRVSIQESFYGLSFNKEGDCLYAS